MRWLSPPDSVPAVRDRVRYSSPTSTRNCNRSLISLRMRRAISRCLGVRLSSSAANQRAASAIEKRVTSPMCRPPILTHSASGLSRWPLQLSHAAVLWNLPSSSRSQALSDSRQRRSRLGSTPSKGLVVLYWRMPSS